MVRSLSYHPDTPCEEGGALHVLDTQEDGAKVVIPHLHWFALAKAWIEPRKIIISV